MDRKDIEARLMFPIASVCFATLGQKKGDLAEAKAALIDEVELMIAEGQARAAKSVVSA